MNHQELEKYAELLKLYQIEVDQRLPKAQEGDREMALNLLSVAAGLLNAKFSLPEKLSEWLALGLHGLASGMSPEASFGFKPPGKGRTAKTAVKIREERFRRAYLTEYLHQTEGISLDKAFLRVADVEFVDHETIKKAWDECHERAKLVLAVSLGQVYHVKEVK